MVRRPLRRKCSVALYRCRGMSPGSVNNPGAGDGNRTRMTSLEGWSSTIELRPQQPLRYGAAVPVAYRPRRLLRAQATSAGAKATVTPGWHSERNIRPGGDEQQMPENAQAQIGVTGLGVM